MRLLRFGAGLFQFSRRASGGRHPDTAGQTVAGANVIGGNRYRDDGDDTGYPEQPDQHPYGSAIKHPNAGDDCIAHQYHSANRYSLTAAESDEHGNAVASEHSSASTYPTAHGGAANCRTAYGGPCANRSPSVHADQPDIARASEWGCDGYYSDRAGGVVFLEICHAGRERERGQRVGAADSRREWGVFVDVEDWREDESGNGRLVCDGEWGDAKV